MPSKGTFYSVFFLMVSLTLLALALTYGGCGGSPENQGAVDICAGCCPKAPCDGGEYVCVDEQPECADPSVVASLRDSLRRAEEQLALAEDALRACNVGRQQCGAELESTAAALAGCNADLGTCADELETCNTDLIGLEEELANCQEDLDYCVCSFTKPGDRDGWWKALNCEEVEE